MPTVMKITKSLLGDLRKFVPVSPQRFVIADNDTGSATYFRVEVLGSAGETVPVTLVTPAMLVTLGSHAPLDDWCTLASELAAKLVLL